MGRFICLVIFALAACVEADARAQASWRFVVAGDSRNCGDVVMPAIAHGARQHRATFYWHLGDLRAIRGIDEDYQKLHPEHSMADYLANAWGDFQQSQIEAFGDIPFIVGIGNHETIAPKTREDFLLTFADWVDQPLLRKQRLTDDPRDHRLRAYFHFLKGGIDFVYLDNATPDQFDGGQLEWLAGVLHRARANPAVRAIVVGMHEALPDSAARGHSMSDLPVPEASGREAYAQLLDAKKSKPVYVLASHSHFVMDRVFDTPYWREHGGVLPGWIVGTAGAMRYALPSGATEGRFARTHVYGYLTGSVSPRGNDADPIHFEFTEITQSMIPGSVRERFGDEFVAQCFSGNAAEGAQ